MQFFWGKQELGAAKITIIVCASIILVFILTGCGKGRTTEPGQREVSTSYSNHIDLGGMQPVQGLYLDFTFRTVDSTYELYDVGGPTGKYEHNKFTEFHTDYIADLPNFFTVAVHYYIETAEGRIHALSTGERCRESYLSRFDSSMPSMDYSGAELGDVFVVVFPDEEKPFRSKTGSTGINIIAPNLMIFVPDTFDFGELPSNRFSPDSLELKIVTPGTIEESLCWFDSELIRNGLYRIESACSEDKRVHEGDSFWDGSDGRNEMIPFGSRYRITTTAYPHMQREDQTDCRIIVERL